MAVCELEWSSLRTISGFTRGSSRWDSFPILFALYIDDLLLELAQSKVGCHWYGTFAGALAYADDITLLAPSPTALRKLLQICENFGASHKMRFNPDKTQCICFCKGNANLSQDSRFLFCGKSIALSTSVTHLGHILTSKLQDDQDIHAAMSSWFC